MSSNSTELDVIKNCLKVNFEMKSIELPAFVRLLVTEPREGGYHFSLRHYVVELLERLSMEERDLLSPSMEPNVQLMPADECDMTVPDHHLVGSPLC
jgi:hypothetical protein